MISEPKKAWSLFECLREITLVSCLSALRMLRRAIATVSNQSMLRRFTFLLVFFTILFGNVAMPTIAHAQAEIADHFVEAVGSHGHDVSSNEDTQKHDSDKPCHAASHHHCGAALRAEVPAMAMLRLSTQLKAIPLSSLKMASLSLAPPTEPPSA